MATALPARPWPIKTREHVDLWLHAFAMITEDDATVPLFARGYRDAMTVTKNSRQFYTKLDEGRADLSRRYKANPAYQGAQFAALYFGSLAELAQAAQLAITMDGDPRKATTREAQAIFTLFGAGSRARRIASGSSSSSRRSRTSSRASTTTGGWPSSASVARRWQPPSRPGSPFDRACNPS